MTQTEPLIKIRKNYVILLSSILVFMIVFEYFSSFENGLMFLFAIFVGSTASAFCTVDSKINNKNLTHIQKMIIFFTWPLALPIYIVFTRKLKGIGIVLIYIIIVLVSANLLISVLKLFT